MLHCLRWPTLLGGSLQQTLAVVVQAAPARPITVSNVLKRSSVPVGKINLGLLIWPFENDHLRVETPEDNLPLLNDYIGVTHLLNFSMLNRELKRGLIPLKKDEEVLWNSEGASPAVASDYQR